MSRSGDHHGCSPISWSLVDEVGEPGSRGGNWKRRGTAWVTGDDLFPSWTPLHASGGRLSASEQSRAEQNRAESRAQSYSMGIPARLMTGPSRGASDRVGNKGSASTVGRLFSKTSATLHAEAIPSCLNSARQSIFQPQSNPEQVWIQYSPSHRLASSRPSWRSGE